MTMQTRTEHVKEVAKCETKAIAIGLSLGGVFLLVLPHIFKWVCQ